MSAWRAVLAGALLAFAPHLLAAQTSDARATAPQPDPRFFHYMADVSPPAATQAYVIVTPEVWRNATSDLRDLRLYSGTEQIAYVLVPGSSEELRGDERAVPVLNNGRVGGQTQFVVDMRQGDSLASYDSLQITVRDDTPDFVAKARIEGLNELAGAPVDLGTSTLFKLEKEKLGANLTLKFSPSVFRYLRVTIPSIEPKAITGARVFSPGTVNPTWTAMEVSASPRNDAHDTVFEWDWTDTVPIGRIQFTVEGNKDFWRRVELRGDHDYPFATGAIWSIKQRADSDRATNYELLCPGEARSKHFKLIVHNGDDPPLKLGIAAAYRERRLYFATPQTAKLQLYFGDGELERPVYDYARTWARSSDAQPAQLGRVQPNPDYTARPDRRPWSERHPAVLWIALAIAVIGLGGVALKSLKRAAPTSPPAKDEKQPTV